MEVWKPIKDYEVYYEVSNLGRIRTMKTGRFHQGCVAHNGYLRIQLTYAGNKKWYPAHRLVAISFLENPDNLPQVNHINGNKLDNSVSNLEWISASNNVRHALKAGLIDTSIRGNHLKGKVSLNAKPVLNVQTGIFYDSITQAAFSINIHRRTLEDHINNRYKNSRKDFIFI